MAIIVPVKMGHAAITTGGGTLMYTTPTARTALLKCFSIANTTGGPLTVQVYLVNSGGSIATTNALIYNLSIATATTYTWTGTQILGAGDFIQVVGSGAGLTWNAAGGEYSSI